LSDYLKNLGSSKSSRCEENVKVTLDNFAKLGIEVQLRTDLATGVEAALSHYVRQLESGRTPVEPPRFLRNRPSRGEETSLELAVGDEARAIIEREARTHGIPLSQVMTHVVFVYLADLDSALERA
jgi:hypothetical protein